MTATNQSLAPAAAEVTAVFATQPEQIAETQSQVAVWCRAKLATFDRDIAEAQENAEIAQRMKHKHLPFVRLAKRLTKQRAFYQKVLLAVEAGYLILPNFDLELYAVRVKEGSRPRHRVGAQYDAHEQRSPGLPAGEGEYVSDVPYRATFSETQTRHDGSRHEVIKSLPTDHDTEPAFPMLAVKPQVLAAAEAAQALRVFDEFGLCQPTRKGDPIVAARIVDRSRKRGWDGQPHCLTFFVGWWLNVEDI